jgi:hypothetical protein
MVCGKWFLIPIVGKRVYVMAIIIFIEIYAAIVQRDCMTLALAFPHPFISYL